jgi:hypothetical protein
MAAVRVSPGWEVVMGIGSELGGVGDLSGARGDGVPARGRDRCDAGRWGRRVEALGAEQAEVGVGGVGGVPGGGGCVGGGVDGGSCEAVMGVANRLGALATTPVRSDVMRS